MRSAATAASSTTGAPPRKLSSTPGVETLTARAPLAAAPAEAPADGVRRAVRGGLGRSSSQHRRTRTIATSAGRLARLSRASTMCLTANTHTHLGAIALGWLESGSAGNKELGEQKCFS